LEEIAMNRLAAIGVLAVLSALTIPVSAQRKAAAAPALEIQALSTRPEMVTGGDVLLQIAGPANLSAKTLTVRVNGKDVSGAFKPCPERSRGGCARFKSAGRSYQWPERRL
jgi:hypothetical protein